MKLWRQTSIFRHLLPARVPQIERPDLDPIMTASNNMAGSIRQLVERTEGEKQLQQTVIDWGADLVCCESTKGVGSTFHLRIPLTGHDLVESSSLSAPPTLHAGPARPALKVLIAEDQEMNIKFTVQILQERGHSVAVAKNGREAPEIWQKDEFDLILMDLQMPVMDGVDATRAIRERERATGHHIPILALTAFAVLGNHQRFLSEGFDGYVSKPIDIESLSGEMLRCHQSNRSG